MNTPSTKLNRLARLSSYLGHDANNAVLRNEAVHEAMALAHWEVALELIDAGVRRRPKTEDLPTTLLLRARCLHHLGHRTEAMAACEALAAISPEDADAQGLWALLLQEEHRHDESRKRVDAALRQNPQQLEALLARASMQSQTQELDSAQVSFKTLLQAHPHCGRGWHGLGLVHLGRMQLEPAERAFEQATTQMPEHVGSWHLLAWLRVLRHDIDAAEQAFERALALDRNFSESHGGLAVIAALQGRDADARAGIRRALRLDAQGMSAQYAELLLLQREGRDKAAAALVEAFLARPAAPGGDMQIRDLVRRRLNAPPQRAPDPAA